MSSQTVYPLADALGFSITIRKEGDREVLVNTVKSERRHPLAPTVGLSLSMEIKASYKSELQAAVWVKIRKALYLYMIYDKLTDQVYAYVVDADKLPGGATVSQHANIDQRTPKFNLQFFRTHSCIVSTYVRKQHAEHWELRLDNIVDGRPVQENPASLGDAAR